MMKREKHLILATVVAVMLAGPAAAQEGPRFGAGGVLQSLDLFADQRATLDGKRNRDSGLSVDFSFHGEARNREPGFLYLQDGDETAPLAEVPVAPPPAAFTPRLSALGGLDRGFDAAGRSRAGSTFTPRYAGAEITLRVTPSRNLPANRSVDLKVSSSFMVENQLGDMALGGLDRSGFTPFDRRSRNLGVSLAYLGFTLGASMTRESGGLEGDYEGVDLGLGYAWSAFSTEISVGEYSRSDGFALGVGREQDFYKLELGAAYALSERIRFSGGVRLFDYSNRFGPGRESIDRAGVLFLGTRLNF